MDAVLAALKERADLVLLDSPPVVAVSDAAVLAAKVDGVLLVVSAGQTRREDVQAAKAKLDKVNAHLLGAVLTNVSLDSSLARYYDPRQEAE
jgi:Mrp family chromosome partitioning ATPase